LAVWVKNNQAIWTQGGVYGPSTKSAFVKFMNNELDGYLDRTRSWISSGTSNGALMRISPAGWANVGNWERASDLACSLVLPTHPTDVALSAAAGLAAGVAEALTDKATVSSIIDAALRGTKHGEIIGKEVARVTANRYPLPNLEYALDLAAKAKDAKEAADLIRTRIGSHFHVSETLATVFGIFYAANGKPEEAILTAVNNGADSDTIASIVGSLCGALYGIKAVPEYWVNTVETINEIKFEQMAEKFVTLNKQK
jgi:ADP-ribosylglycohydrolase